MNRTHRETWSAQLRTMAAQPLEYCPELPAIARRFEAWWAYDVLDRPVFIASADKNPDRPIRRRLELLDQPDAWFEAKMANMLQLHRVGDKLPSFRVDFGPVMLGGLFGGRVEFVSDTTWTFPMIRDDWSNAPAWNVEGGAWWPLVRARLAQAAEAARGRFVVSAPALGGSADVLLNLRGSEPLCLDVVEQPERIREALDAIHLGWVEMFEAEYRLVVERGAAIIHWPGIWSSEPYIPTECDFCIMLGPRQFKTLFLPDVARQAGTAGRSIFHLDGPGATRHLDALLDTPELQAIQFVPGAGVASVLPYTQMYQKIQAAGRSLQILCPPEEVLPLADALKPEGLAFWLETPLPPADLDDLFREFCKRYGQTPHPVG